MTSPRERRSPWAVVGRAAAWIGIVAIGAALLVGPRLHGTVGNHLASIATGAIALILEAAPFLLVGAVFAALLSRGPGRRLLRLVAGHPRWARALAPLTGLALPLCDCGVFPIARELQDAGADSAVVAGFVAGAPLTNPIVIVSTLIAFPGAPGVALARVVVGTVTAMVVSAVAAPPATRRRDPIVGDDCDLHHRHSPHPAAAPTRPRVFADGVIGELSRTGPVLVLAAIGASTLRSSLPLARLVGLDRQPLIAAGAMMLLAFVLSLCSQADAFFASALPIGALPRLAFLVTGPMLDLRLAVLYQRAFGWRWILTYGVAVAITVPTLAAVWVTWVAR